MEYVRWIDFLEISLHLGLEISPAQFHDFKSRIDCTARAYQIELAIRPDRIRKTEGYVQRK